jgi:hypothetical protein
MAGVTAPIKLIKSRLRKRPTTAEREMDISDPLY